MAQNDAVSVGFDIKKDIALDSFDVVGCEYVAPSLNGAELNFNCPLNRTYQVNYTEKNNSEQVTEYGNVQVRPNLQYGKPIAGVLYVVKSYTSDEKLSLKEFMDLPANLKPLSLSDANDTQVAQKASPVTVAQNTTEALAVVTDGDVVINGDSDGEADERITVSGSNPVDDPSKISLSWDASYGSIRINGDTLLDELQQADGLIEGQLNLTESLGSLFILSSDRNLECNKSYSVSQLKEAKELFFDCTQHTIKVPYELPLVGKKCLTVNATEVDCLVSNSKKVITLEFDGWESIDLNIVEDSDAIELDPIQLKPKFASQSMFAKFQEMAEDQCDPKNLQMRLGAYCLNDLCTATPAGLNTIQNNGYLMNLTDAGWVNKGLPNRAQFSLVEIINGGEVVVGEDTVSLNSIPEESINALVAKAAGKHIVPLNITIPNDIYKVGRTAKIFSDAICKTAVPKSILDLSNPGNKIPDVPKCSFYRVFDNNKPRSQCTAVSYDKETETASGALDITSCGSKRLLIYVAENENLNGLASKAIVESLRKIATNLNGMEKCGAIDIVHTADEKREILLTAEDMHFAEGDNDLRVISDLRFVNSNSEILRDLEWIYRKWGDTLGGLIVIADGDDASPRNMIDSPASMAWKIKDVYRKVLNFSEAQNCSVFKDILLFEECEQGQVDTFEASLSAYVDQGLASLAVNNSE